MKKISCFLFSIVLLLSACTTQPKENIEEDISSPKPLEINTYTYTPENHRFYVVSLEHIDNGSSSGILIYTLADRNTKVMYALTRMKSHKEWSTTMEVLLDQHGKPLLYEKE